MIGDDQQHVACRRRGPASTGKQRCCRHRATAAVAASSAVRAARRTRRRRLRRAGACRSATSRSPSSLSAAARRRCCAPSTESRSRPPSRSAVIGQFDRVQRTARRGPVARRRATSMSVRRGDRRSAASAAELVDGEAADGISRSTASSQVSHDRGPGGRARRRGSKRPPPTSRSARPVLQLQEPHHARESTRTASGPHQALRGQRVSSPMPASAAPGGPSTPNCQRDWFFRESRGTGRAGSPRRAPRRRRRVHGPTRRSWDLPRREFAASSEVIASSKPSRPRAERYAGERVDGVAVQPHPAGVREVLLRSDHARRDTGMSKRSSQSHGTCWTAKPLDPRPKTVPLNRNCSGIVPSRSACRYFAAATSKS